MNLIVDVGRRTVASLIYVFTLLFLFDDHSKKYKSMTISVEGQQRYQSNSANRQKVSISIWMRRMEEIISFGENVKSFRPKQLVMDNRVLCLMKKY